MSGQETPATRALQAAGVLFTVREYVHDPSARAFATEAAEQLGQDPARVFKTLMVDTGEAGLVVAMVPAVAQLRLKAVAKGATMAAPDRAQAATGYVVGGISPFGQRRAHRTLLDEAAADHGTIFVSGGRRGLQVEVAPADLIALTRAELRRLT